jgi:hypothetical protein
MRSPAHALGRICARLPVRWLALAGTHENSFMSSVRTVVYSWERQYLTSKRVSGEKGG